MGIRGVHDMNEILNLRGTVKLATYEMLPEWDGLDFPTIATLLVGQTPVEEATAHNTLCNVGLDVLVQAIMWAGIVDQNVNMGSPFSYSDLTAMYGAIGTGNIGGTPAAATDTQLLTEYERAVVVSAGVTSGFSTFNPSVTWQFLLGATGSATTITECGIFVNASSAANSGALLNHAAVSVSQSTTQLVSLAVQITVGN